MLGVGIILMIAAQAVLSYASSISGVVFGIILVGLHMGATQGLIKALIAQATPPELRGTAFSSFLSLAVLPFSWPTPLLVVECHSFWLRRDLSRWRPFFAYIRCNFYICVFQAKQVIPRTGAFSNSQGLSHEIS